MKYVFILFLLLSNFALAMDRNGDMPPPREIPEYNEPQLLSYSNPSIQGRNILISTWSIMARSGFTLFFTLVFDRETNTPDRPIYALQGHSLHQARTNHEAAEEWAALNIRGLSPLNLNSPAQRRSPGSSSRSPVLVPSPPSLRRQTPLYRMEASQSFHVMRAESNSTTPEEREEDSESLPTYDGYLSDSSQ